jgi:Ca-activated chloride channel family protein
METTALTFGAPDWLWALAIPPLIAILFVWSQRRSRALVAKVVAPRLFKELAGSVSPLRRVFRAFLLLSAIALAIVALAQPRYGFIERETKQKGRDVVVAIDTSRSMLATDISPTRLARAKLFTQDLIRLLHGDRVGLVAFAGSAFLQAPLTLDYNAVTNALGELDTTVIPKGGTNIAEAIRTAREAFGKAEGQTRALVILTDGEELDSDGIAAAKQAESEGIRIFTIGIGSPEGSLIPIRTEEGRPDFVRDGSGKPVTSKLDSTRLQEIATATGGFFTIIGPEAAREIFQKGIEPMELTEMGVFSARQPIERYQWPLAVATACLALSLLPGDRRRRPTSALVAAILLALSSSAHAQTGLESYKNGEFEKADAAFQDQLKSQPGSPSVQFNAGTTAYKTGNFEKAITHFTDALLAEESKLREDASYNLANALVRKGEASKENEAKKNNWKSALEHYEETLRLNSDNKLAKENQEITKKLLEDLEKQEQEKKQQEQDKKDEQQKDKQDKQDKPQDQQQDKKDSQEEKDKDDQQKQDQEKKDEQSKKDQEQQDKEEKDQQENKKDPSDQSDAKKDDQQKPQPVPTPTPGDKKEGELKSANEQPTPQPTPEPAQQKQAEAAGEEEKEGQISPSQARALLNALRGEEEKVNLMEQQQTSQDVLRDW